MRSHDRRSGHRLGLASVAALACVAFGCSGGDVALSTTTVPAPTTTQTATTQPATTVSATVVTTVPTTAPATVPATTAPTPSVPATFAPGSVEAQVVDATMAAWRLYTAALEDPFNDDAVRAAGQAHTGPVLQTVIENIAEYRLKNWRSTPNPDVPTSFTLYPGGVVVDAAAGTASVTYCDVNSAIVVVPGGNSDGSDLVVNDNVSSQKVRLDMQLVDGRWVAGGGELVMDWAEMTMCPDLP